MYGLFFAFPMLIKMSCIYSFCSLISTMVYSYKLSHYRTVIKMTLREQHFSSANLAYQMLYIARIDRFYREYTRICVHILYGNAKIWSTLMLSFLCTNVPANVYFINHIFFDHLPVFESIFFSVFLTVQMAAATFILIRLSKNSQLIHSFARYIPPIQQLIRGRAHLLYKLKFDQLLHRLTSGKKYGMSVGFIISITYESVVKVMVKMYSFKYFELFLSVFC